MIKINRKRFLAERVVQIELEFEGWSHEGDSLREKGCLHIQIERTGINYLHHEASEVFRELCTLIGVEKAGVNTGHIRRLKKGDKVSGMLHFRFVEGERER
jgi:hypothetical protein